MRDSLSIRFVYLAISWGLLLCCCHVATELPQAGRPLPATRNGSCTSTCAYCSKQHTAAFAVCSSLSVFGLEKKRSQGSGLHTVNVGQASRRQRAKKAEEALCYMCLSYAERLAADKHIVQKIAATAAVKHVVAMLRRRHCLPAIPLATAADVSWVIDAFSSARCA